jgi:hypothetical protein
MRWEGHVECIEEMKIVYRILAPLRIGLENNIKIYLRVSGCEVLSCINLTQGEVQWRFL